MKCVKCGCRLSYQNAIDWDVSGSSHRYICPECAEEEGITEEDFSYPTTGLPEQSGFTDEQSVFTELTKQEKSIERRIDRLLRDMKKAGLCIFINDGTLEVYRGKNPPHTRFDGSVDNTKSIMSFGNASYCYCDGGATL